ncbi:hypothetical protein HYV81_05915 [Candidatus Woesearchaeota archaeon]|nr:hypothetical protein [Candidatus Woesearchaeota archaeon]
MYRRTLEFIRNYEYPRLTAVALSFILAYIMFKNQHFHILVRSLHGLNYPGVFIAGLLSVFSFTAPIAVAFFLLAGSEVNIYAATVVAATGALLADMFIFEFVKLALLSEINHLAGRQPLFWILAQFKRLPYSLRKQLSILVACIFIASPLPDEIGVALLAAFTRIHEKAFALLSFFLNAAGLFVIFYIAQHIPIA